MSEHETARPIYLTERDRWLSECSCGWEQIAHTEVEARLAWKTHKSAMDEQTERLTLSNDTSRNEARDPDVASLEEARSRACAVWTRRRPVMPDRPAVPPADFEDGPNPCVCPPEVIEALALAVRYAEASLGSSKPDAVLGAEYVKTFMEQPSEVWCQYISEGAVQ